LHAMKVHAGCGYANPIVLTSTLGANRGQIQAPATLASWKSSSVPTGEKARWAVLAVWKFWKKKYT
jgi:hypothetical protein